VASLSHWGAICLLAHLTIRRIILIVCAVAAAAAVAWLAYLQNNTPSPASPAAEKAKETGSPVRVVTASPLELSSKPTAALLPPAGYVAGRVYYINSPDSVNGASLTLEYSDVNSDANETPTVLSLEGDGTFRAPVSRAGHYQLICETGPSSDAVVVTGVDYALDLFLGGGQQLDGLDFPYSKGGKFFSRLLAGGQPVSGARATLAFQRKGESESYVASVADTKGLIAMGGIPPAADYWLLRLTAAGFESEFQRFAELPNTTIARPYEIQLKKAAILRGQLLNQNEQAVQALITLHAGQRHYGAQSDEQGRFEINDLAAGEYVSEVVPQHIGVGTNATFPHEPSSFHIAPASIQENVVIRVNDTVPGKISGRVISPSGAPLKNVLVYTSEAEQCASARTGAEGTFELDCAVSSGVTDLLLCQNPPLRTQLVSGVTIGDEDLELVFEDAGSILAAVETRGEHAPTSLHYWLKPHTESVPPVLDRQDTVYTSSGQFILYSVHPGTYDLTVSSPGYTAQTLLNLVVKSGVQSRADFKFETAGIVTGTVRNDASVPIPNAVVNAISAETSFSPAVTTDSAGQFRFDSLSEGTWVLVVPPVAGYKEHRQTISLSGSGSKEVTIRLRNSTTVFGVVTAQGAAVQIARVNLVPLSEDGSDDGTGDILTESTAENGYYQFNDVPAGLYRWSVLCDSGIVTEDVEFHEGMDYELNQDYQ
jgi:hypothetical protein